jgi:phosphoglucomutase
LDEELRAQLYAIRDDEAQIQERFYTNLAFGTAGMRGVLGAGTNRMNRYTVRRATLGYARFLKERFGEQARTRGVVIAHDNRRMSREFCMDTAGVLAAEGIQTYVFDSLRPTPELSFAVRYLGTAGGVMITASHNPPEHNGYKAYDEHGCQLVPRYTDRLSVLVDAIADPLTIPVLTQDQAGDLIETLGADVDEAYYRAVMDIQLRDVDAKSLRIVYSPQHGTGNLPVRTVLSRCGYNVTAVEEQCPPDPNFSATKSPNPENEDAYEAALAYAQRIDADIAIITDPDCDRLGVVAKQNGKFRLMTGNQSGTLLLYYILSTHRERGTLPKNAVMCNTIVTSSFGDRLCANFGVEVAKTATGFKFIGDKIREYEQTGEKTYLFGYEESYGCLISPLARDKDAVQASLMLCEAAAYYKAQGKTLWDVLQECYDAFGYFLDSITSVVHEGKAGVQKINDMVDSLRQNPPAQAAGIPVLKMEDYLSPEMQAKGFPASNALRFLMADGSFAAVRPSGTEPKCKYYYGISGKDEEEARAKLMQFRAVFEGENAR